MLWEGYRNLFKNLSFFLDLGKVVKILLFFIKGYIQWALGTKKFFKKIKISRPTKAVEIQAIKGCLKNQRLETSRKI